MIGRYYRSADGSFREEQQTIDGTLKLVSISNIPTATAYLFNSRRGETWVQKPMLLSPDGFKPLRYRQGTRNLTAHIERVEGFDVYKYVDANGAVNLQAPALNFFGLVTERPRGDRLERRVYYNVHVREQAREFFEPPSGVAMEYDSRPIPNGVRVSTPQPAQ